MNLTQKPDFVTRPAMHFVFMQKQGPFAEVAIPAWIAYYACQVCKKS